MVTRTIANVKHPFTRTSGGLGAMQQPRTRLRSKPSETVFGFEPDRLLLDGAWCRCQQEDRGFRKGDVQRGFLGLCNDAGPKHLPSGTRVLVVQVVNSFAFIASLEDGMEVPPMHIHTRNDILCTHYVCLAPH